MDINGPLDGLISDRWISTTLFATVAVHASGGVVDITGPLDGLVSDRWISTTLFATGCSACQQACSTPLRRMTAATPWIDATCGV